MKSSRFSGKNKFQGLTVDFEEVPASAQKNLKAFLTEMSQALSGHGMALVLAVPFDDDEWPYADYAKIADYLLLMGYDEHWDGSRPGSIAGQVWFEDALDKRMKDLDPDRTIIAIGGYGYDWVKGQATQELTFEEAVLSARRLGSRNRVRPGNEQSALLLHRGRREAARRVVARRRHRLQRNPRRRCLPSRRLRGVAVGLRRSLDLVGDGPALRRARARISCARSARARTSTSKAPARCYAWPRSRPRASAASRSTTRPARSSTRLTQAVPTPFVIERTGDTRGKLALTFDDGPDPDWTPQDPRHPEGQGCPRHLLHHRRERRSQSGPRAAAGGRRPRGRQPHLHPPQSRRDIPAALVDAGAQCDPASVRGADRPLDATVPRRPISATPSPRRATRSCRSRSPRAWATSPSACMSIPTTGRAAGRRDRRARS